MTRLVSVHGGHSLAFCSHAKGYLEEIIATYYQKKAIWVGITEHMPAISGNFSYDEERNQGLTAAMQMSRFEDYFKAVSALQKQYENKLDIIIGMEADCYTGCIPFVRDLLTRFPIQYIVGSVHHVNDIPLDMSQAGYDALLSSCGGYENLYEAYFDIQFEMLKSLQPAVVGHFELIRIFDKDYVQRLKVKSIWDKILRNLDFIASYDGTLDYNLRAMYSWGFSEGYISRAVLEQAHARNINIVPGDDSHSASDIDKNFATALKIFEQVGISTNWKKPKLFGI